MHTIKCYEDVRQSTSEHLHSNTSISHRIRLFTSFYFTKSCVRLRVCICKISLATIYVQAAELIHAVYVYVDIVLNEMRSTVYSYFSRVRYQGTNSVRGCRAGTIAAAHNFVCLVRCCSWRRKPADDLTRLVGSCAFSGNFKTLHQLTVKQHRHNYLIYE